MAKRIPILLGLILPAAARFALSQCPDGTAPPCREASARAPAPNSIAVLSFRAADTAHTQLAEGLSENVATSLAGLGGLVVTPRSQVREAERATGGEPDRLTRALGVRFTVEGSLFPFGNRLRLAVKVDDVPAGSTLFSRAYDAAADSLAELAPRVARDVAREAAPPAPTPRPTSQKVLLVLSGLLPAVAQVAGALIFIWGVVVVAVGTFTAGRARLRGRTARIAGLFLVSQLPLALAVSYAVHRAQFHGDEVARATSQGFAAAAVWALFAIAGAVGARMYAQGKLPAGGAASPRRESA